jgi:hypothetical protein
MIWSKAVVEKPPPWSYQCAIYLLPCSIGHSLRLSRFLRWNIEISRYNAVIQKIERPRTIAATSKPLPESAIATESDLHNTMKKATTVRFDEASTQTFLFDSAVPCKEDNSHFLFSKEALDTFRRIMPETSSKSFRHNHVASILAQQWEHQRLGIQDPKGLRMLSTACSKSARKRASAVAMQNAQEVHEIEPTTTTVKSKYGASKTIEASSVTFKSTLGPSTRLSMSAKTA